MARIAITDGMAPNAIKHLENSGHEVVVGFITKDDLLAGALADFDAVIIRSATKMSAAIISANSNLKVIGRAGVGVDNIDLLAAKEHGVMVVNAPRASTQSVIELTIGHLLTSIRHITSSNRGLRSGLWEKKKMTDNVKWSPEDMLEVTIKQPDDFLKVRETLTRIGVASRKEKKLYQSCHILHKQGRYYIVHFKELFALDGKHANLTANDVQRRNRITRLLSDWGLISVVKTESVADIAPLNQIKVLSYKDKGDWILEQKYNIGKKGKKEETES